MTATHDNALLKRRLVLIGLFVLFIAPIGLAWLMVNNVITWRPSGTKAHGDLIKPPFSLQGVHLKDAQGKGVELTGHLGTWTMLFIGPDACLATCAQRLIETRQVRLAVGRDIPRVRRLYLLPEKAGGEALPEVLRKANPDLIVVHDGIASDPALAALDRRINLKANQILFVDSQGYAMMRYRLGQPARGILQDLQLLLRASQTE